MLVFEYAAKLNINPTSLINDDPSIWRWSSPSYAIASWMSSVFGVSTDTDITQAYSIIGATVDYTNSLLEADDYADLLTAVDSFYWDRDSQTVYFNFGEDNPHAYENIYILNTVGFTDTILKVYNNIPYLPLILNKPSVSLQSDPTIYQRAQYNDVTIELRNDDIVVTLGDDSLSFAYRFDAEQDIVGQIAYLKYGAIDTLYDDLKILAKCSITNNKTSLDKYTIISEDLRGKLDENWPIYTWEDAGYSSDEVEEDLVTKVIPDGYGKNYKVEGNCVNRDTSLIEVDEDGVIVLPSNLLTYDISAWTLSNCTAVKTSKELAKFTMYRIEKSSGSIDYRVYKNITATATRHKFTGYVSTPELYVEGTIRISVYLQGYMEIDFDSKTCSVTGDNIHNLSYKFLGEGDSEVYLYYSFECSNFTVGSSYSFNVYPRYDATDAHVVYLAGLRVTEVEYPTFVFTRELTEVHSLYYEKDGELVPILDYDPAPYNPCPRFKDDGSGIDGDYNYVNSTDESITAGVQVITPDAGSPNGIAFYLAAPAGDSIIWEAGHTYAFIIQVKSSDPLVQISLYGNDTAQAPQVIDSVDTWQTVGIKAASTVADTTYLALLDTTEASDWLPIYTKNWKIIDLTDLGEESTDIDDIISEYYRPYTVTVYDVDAHVDGDVTKGLNKLYADMTARPETNPFDVIKDLNDEARNIPYLDSFYNKTVCEAESPKLANVGFIKNEPTSVFNIIVELQGGSTVGFRYDDIDLITIKCDDPNRLSTFDIPKEWILNIDEVEVDANVTLYADVVTVQHSYNNYKGSYVDYKNSDYKKSVLLRYIYEKPLIYPSLLTSETDAINATKVKLEDLSIARAIYTIKVPLEYFTAYPDIYDIGYVQLSAAHRTFKGRRRVQVIGIEYDTEFEFINITLRERTYSQVFADITGSYTHFVLGEAVTPEVLGEAVTPAVLGQLEE